MDRTIVYPGAIPLDTDLLNPQRDAMIGLGWLLQATMGTATGVVGLACAPTAPASMVVNVGQGAIWAAEEIDPNAFGSLPADTSPLMKMGILPEGSGTNFTLTAPTTSGDSINYLIEATFQEADGSPVVLPYVNPANPSQPYSGPNNSGTAQNTVRTQIVELQLKAGAAAPTGSQTTPAVDTGYVGLYVITVAYGQTTITASDINVLADAPFMDFYAPDDSAQIASVIKAAGLTPDRTNTAQLLAAEQKLFAAINGSSSEAFNAYTLTLTNGAGSSAQIYADSASAIPNDLVIRTGASGAYAYNIFQPDGRLTLAAPGTGNNDAVPLGQAQANFAAINGSASEAFNVANATTSTEAVPLGQFNVSNSAGSGYAVLPNGLILQWGNQVLPSSNTSYTYNFPIAFPKACVGFGTATKSLSGPTTSALGSVLNNSQYSLTNNSTIANAPQFWFAIGY